MRRYQERYGIQLTDFDYRVLCSRVFSCVNGGASIGTERIAGDLYCLCVGGAFVFARWDDRTMQIATFIPASVEVSRRAVEIAARTGVSSPHGIRDMG